MKKYIFIATVPLLVMSCNQAELDQASYERDSLRSVVRYRDSSQNQLLGVFNDVERNLDSISVKQHIILRNSTKYSGEIRTNQKERINEQIKAINNLMDKNRETIVKLEKEWKASVGRNSNLKKVIVTLNNQLAQKDIELASLNEKLVALNIQVNELQTFMGNLMEENFNQSQTIAEGTAALHTAYYVIGKPKDLQEAKLIDRKGGLLGIGKTAKLSSNFDHSKFTQIDYTKLNVIPINSDHVKIVTTHPSDSYTLNVSDKSDENIVTNLVITNPEKFWSASKYLVITQ